jgi:multicomponent Na+:H+ antiporter subunit B
VTRRGRLALFVPAVIAFGVGLLLAFGGLPDFGHYAGVYGLTLEHVALPETHSTNLVAPVVFDYRGLDTLGEEFILFAAVAGCAILLRAQRDEATADDAARLADDRADATARPVRALGAALVGPTVVLGGYVIAHGQLTPGGGFQGGVILAAAAVLVYVAGQYVSAHRVGPITRLELIESAGAAGFALLGLGGLLAGGAALENFLGLGSTGSVFSAGTIPLANVAVGIEVWGGITLIVAEFLDQALLRRRSS